MKKRENSFPRHHEKAPEIPGLFFCPGTEKNIPFFIIAVYCINFSIISID
jgi:hypothetical protein